MSKLNIALELEGEREGGGGGGADARICGFFAKVSQDFWPGFEKLPKWNRFIDTLCSYSSYLTVL